MSMDTDTVSPSEELKDDALNQIDEAIAALEAARKLIPAAVRHLADAEGLTSLIAGYARQLIDVALDENSTERCHL